jgi:hypothetical protein
LVEAPPALMSLVVRTADDPSKESNGDKQCFAFVALRHNQLLTVSR